jgi:hypothetical protein
MKALITIVFLVITQLLMAQENSKASPPVIVAKVALGETVAFEQFTITFSNVVEDSRCPSDVTCVWAGQAKVLITIKSNDTTSEKELIFHGTNFGSESENTFFVSETKTYIGYRLSPYPVSTTAKDNRAYVLEVYGK